MLQARGGRRRRVGGAREEGAAAQHAGLQQAAGRAQEELHVVPARELRQPRVQLGGDDHRARQVRVHLRPRARARPRAGQRLGSRMDRAPRQARLTRSVARPGQTATGQL